MCGCYDVLECVEWGVMNDASSEWGVITVGGVLIDLVWCVEDFD